MIPACCYCNVRQPSSDDHIFPQFMGGKTTIRVCKQCNDRFGHTFEATISEMLSPLVVKLREVGIMSPRRVIWRRAFQRDGIDFDLDTDWNAWPSKPLIERDESGKFTRVIFATEKAASGFLRGTHKSGQKFAVDVKRQQEAIQVPPLTLRLEISGDLHRLAMKMAVATAQFMGFRTNLLDDIARSYLLGEIPKGTHVRLDYQTHVPLERLRPPLSHLVFVKGNRETGRCYAIVQMYGLMQYYVILNDKGFSAPQFACTAILDVARNYQEKFEIAEPLGLREAPIQVNRLYVQWGSRQWREKFNSEAEMVVGKGKLLLGEQSLEAYNY